MYFLLVCAARSPTTRPKTGPGSSIMASFEMCLWAIPRVSSTFPPRVPPTLPQQRVGGGHTALSTASATLRRVLFVSSHRATKVLSSLLEPKCFFFLRCSHKERLLSISSYHRAFFGELITNRTPQCFRRRRTTQHQSFVSEPVVLSCRSDRLSECKEDGGPHKQGRLAYPFAAGNGPQVFPADRLALTVVLEHTNVELLRDVSKPRNLVRARSGGDEGACSGVPQRLFHGEEPLALDKGTLDLAIIQSRVDRVSNVLSSS